MTAELPNINRATQETINIPTWGRGMYEITDQVQGIVEKSKIQTGICHVYLHNNSASLIVCEKAESLIRRALETLITSLVPDADDDSDQSENGIAHLRSALTPTSITVPVTKTELAVGRWQAIFIWEHKRAAQQRTLTITVQGI